MQVGNLCFLRHRTDVESPKLAMAIRNHQVARRARGVDSTIRRKASGHHLRHGIRDQLLHNPSSSRRGLQVLLPSIVPDDGEFSESYEFVLFSCSLTGRANHQRLIQSQLHRQWRSRIRRNGACFPAQQYVRRLEHEMLLNRSPCFASPHLVCVDRPFALGRGAAGADRQGSSTWHTQTMEKDTCHRRGHI